jgi:predicted ATPase
MAAAQAEVSDQIIGRTDGVPLFVEELTKTVLESGLLREGEDDFERPMIRRTTC